MRRRQLLRALGGIAGAGLAGCSSTDEPDAEPTDVEIDRTSDTPTPDGRRTTAPTRTETTEETPTRTPEDTPTRTPTETPTRTPAPSPGVEVDSEAWVDDREGEPHLFVDGDVHNPQEFPLEVELVAAGWYESPECTDDDPDDPDWTAEPERERVIYPGVTWSPLEPWTVPLARFEDCGFESPQVWPESVERED